MSRRRATAMAGAILAMLALSGCAMAVPFAAAGAMATSRGVRGETIESIEQKRLAQIPPAPQAAPADAADSALIVMTDLTELPPPSGAPSRLDLPAIRSFAAYALAQSDEEMPVSARLETPELLAPQRADCEKRPPAVLIDLDPGRQSVDPFEPIRVDRELSEALARLRLGGVAIAWQSRLGEGFAERLRVNLAESGLDPDGADRLLLLPSIEDRKQTQREALDASHCIIAMLGDERADFDELYLYLKNPDAAFGLDRMLGDGWFLAPGAITQTSETN